uniref:Uncharacterized protein n=1 Tax=Arundo donax TaxID=35708 RepID=A0A0A8YD39_ARUDO
MVALYVTRAWSTWNLILIITPTLLNSDNNYFITYVKLLDLVSEFIYTIHCIETWVKCTKCVNSCIVHVTIEKFIK